MIVGGGGTGGHLFPGLAVAREISRRCERAQVLFVTGRRRMESEILQRAGFQQASIAVEGLKGRGWKKGAMVLVKLPYSLFQSLGIIRAFRPDLSHRERLKKTLLPQGENHETATSLRSSR